MRKKLTILGSTGSVGLSTISVVNQNMPRFEVFALTGNTQIDLLADQCIVSKPSFAVVTSEKAASKLRSLLADKSLDTEVLVGDEGLNYVSSAPEVDIVMSAIVGAQGLLPTRGRTWHSLRDNLKASKHSARWLESGEKR